MNENDLKRFDDWYSDNYNNLQKYCNKYKIDEDLINDVYVNCHNRIERSGFTESYFTTYVKRSLQNLYINEKKKYNNKHFIDFDCEDYTNTIEDVLLDKDETEKDTQQYREEVLYFSKMVFLYIERNYNEQYQFIFRCYYLMPDRFTYAKLNKMTGYNKNLCTKVIRTMKNDIKNNFINWLKKQDGSK